MKIISVAHVRFGQRIKNLRRGRGLTQEDLAFKIGIDRSYMGFLERGERNPTLDKIVKIANVFEITLSELLQGV